MRNEIFQQIKKNKLKFYSETLEHPKSEINPQPSERKPKATKLFNVLKKIPLPQYAMSFRVPTKHPIITFNRMAKPLIKSVYRQTRSLFNATFSMKKWIEKRADQIKYQMADFLMVLFADEEYLIPVPQAANNVPFAEIPSPPGYRKTMRSREVIFFIGTQSSIAWAKVQNQATSYGHKLPPLILKKPLNIGQAGLKLLKQGGRIKQHLSASFQRVKQLFLKLVIFEKTRRGFQRKQQKKLKNALFFFTEILPSGYQRSL